MNTRKPEYIEGLVRLPLERGPSIDLSPQECWELVKTLRSFLMGNATTFDQPPTVVIKKNNKSFRVILTKWFDWWRKVQDSSWEPNTYKIFDSLVSSDCIYLDIGAWIGPTVLYAAQLAKRAYAFEPDPIAYRELEANVAANKDADWVSRLTIYDKAVAATSGTLKLGSRSRCGDSMSSVLFSGENANWESEAITLEQLIEAEKLQNEKLFIKVDIEGGEYELIPSLKRSLSRYDVDLYLSIHPRFLSESLVKRKGGGIQAKLMRRLLLVRHQVRLLHSLPFRYLYLGNGQRVNIFAQNLKALLTGSFVCEIVATNKKWAE